MKNSLIIKLGMVALATMLFTGCSDKSDWGVDNPDGMKISHGPLDSKTGKYRCDYDKGDATLVKPGSEVKPLTDDAEVRLWHFQNSDEYACLLKGNAIIIGEK